MVFFVWSCGVVILVLFLLCEFQDTKYKIIMIELKQIDTAIVSNFHPTKVLYYCLT